ncbi:MAG: phosphate ABC transporter permease subunit PstC [Syntrophomonas sp.]|uniref:phosphate ABC transporter permease subunit PstC n=1 Tax=Syntrophomonas sp. TaxID=2053627 RepID=UPI00261E3003|nr:phosphate ABC transporter permease subunit PstC [Syntrophomonas sp.]MDD2511458.1 phosphate ABC transporter permease subunit PstC [Syntrophomonas sp.]MDD4627606.1 phosphate ABC transporter permease subunit PstC [Syntrophomonas sp.]
MNGIIEGKTNAVKQHNNREEKMQILQAKAGRWERILVILRKSKARFIPEILVEKLLMLSAVVSIMALLLISVFIFSRGVPLIASVGLGDFLFSLEWKPIQGKFGIGAMFVGSLLLTSASLAWAVPLGLLTAIFMAEIAPPPVGRIMTRMVSLLAGIPSVVYGFFGLVIIVPLIRNYLGGTGMSVLAGAIILGIMILPTIINISRDAIQAVPLVYKESSLALGASHYQTIGRLILPAASSGIITAVVLAMGRAIGETMAVVMVTGNAPIIPDSLLAPLRTMTSNIVLEMGYAAGDHQAALFATGAILFIFILLLNLLLNFIRRAGKRYAGN